MHHKLWWLFFLLTSLSVTAQKNFKASFKIVPLGVKGGSDESNLSAYMAAPANSSNYICLDAGTIYFGIKKAIRAGIFQTKTEDVLKKYIKAYLISHPHLDHLSGMLINSPHDSSKSIYGSQFCLDILKDKYFTWKNWANFTNKGDKPTGNKYRYNYLTPNKETAVENTEMYVTAFLLSHSNPYQSTAFLVRHGSSYILYLGDTGADETEKSDKLHLLWQYIAPLITLRQLKGIFIEVSFPNQQPVKQLFGHLTPNLLMNEMQRLANMAGSEKMKRLKVLITHVKPSGNHEAEIKRQLLQSNKLHLQLMFPQQAQLLKL